MVKNKIFSIVKASGIALFAFLLSGCQGVALLDPKGPVGDQITNLMMITVGLGFLVVVPVIGMAIWFAVRYRESNTKATYKPHWEGSLKIEAVIWLVPVAIIVVLSYLTFVKTIDLDPYKPIASTEKALTVQVITTDWNWIFLYPEYGVASVNKLMIPAGAPVTFDMTSASVMTSMFIPDLGSQMYIMAGMVSHLNLLAHEPGQFTGKNMVYSGEGYDKMHFQTVAMPADQFQAWTESAKSSPTVLGPEQFAQLIKPQPNLPPAEYSSVDPGLFSGLVAKFMPPQGEGTHEKSEMPMDMSN